MPRHHQVPDRQEDSSEPLEATREFVTDRLRSGDAPSEVAAALTYVATETSLQLAPNPLTALPFLLGGILEAAQAHETSSEGTGAETIPDAAVPGEYTVH